MAPLLVLLALLCVSTIAARRDAFTSVVAAASTPLLVGAGGLVGPSGLSFLGPGLIADMAPAVDVGLAWLALFAAIPARDEPSWPRSLGVAFVAACGTFAVARLLHEGDADLLALFPVVSAGAALAFATDGAGSAGQRAPIARGTLIATFAALVAMVAIDPLRGALVAALGLWAAALVLLLARQPTVPPVVAALAGVLLLTGLCRLTQLPVAIGGLVAGVVLASVPAGAVLTAALAPTVPAVRLALLVLLGAALPVFSSGPLALALGAALGLAAAGLGAVLRTSRAGHASLVPVLVAAGLASVAVTDADSLLPVLLVAVAVADAVRLVAALWRAARGRA